MNAWSNLPNAAHIDRVLAHVRAHPEKWKAARDAAWDVAYGAAYGAAYDVAYGAAWGAARDVAYGAAYNAASTTHRYPVWGACAALVAWDEAGDLLSAPVATVRFLAQEGAPAAMLLLPAVIAMEVESERVE